MFVYEKIRTIRALVDTASVAYKDNDFMRTMVDNEIKATTFGEFAEKCKVISDWVFEYTNKLGHRVRVAMLSPNNCRYITLFMGVMYGGGISIPIDPQINHKTLCGCINKAEVDIVINAQDIKLDTDVIKNQCPCVSKIMTMEEWEEEISVFNGTKDKVEITEKDCAVILFTSGTTGEEKGVMLSNGNLADSVFNTNHEKHNIKLNILPMHHAFCINADILLCFTNCTTVCLNGDTSKLGENLLIFKPTLLAMVPMVAQALYNQLLLMAQKEGKEPSQVKEKIFGPNVKKIVAGGAHLPAELVEKYQKLGIFLCQGYGMTECSPTIASPDMSRPDKAHTAGRVVIGCKTRVVDGELQVKSPSVMMGYVNAPRLTAEVITEDGWLRTGDIGYEDDEGFLHITGRMKNLIILSNGANVSPEQIENMLLDFQIVQETLVYGEGNTIVAEIYPNSKYATLNNIRNIKGKIEEVIAQVNSDLPSYKKIMKLIIRTAPFDRTSTNKIKRNQRASKDQILTENGAENKKPETELQSKMYDCLCGIMGHKNFGVDTNVFDAGLDSLGCVLMLTTFSNELDFHITLDEVMAAATIEKLEKLYQEKSNQSQVDYTPRSEYPLSFVQMFFAYAMRGNTTANVPVVFQLDKSVDLEKLKKAIIDLFDVHPILRNVIAPSKMGYANFRDDNRPVDIPVYKMDEISWELGKNKLITPFKYTADSPLYHIALYDVGSSKYMLFDIAHIISDGTSLSIMLNNINKLYRGEKVEKEKYTFYDYILDEKHRQELGVLQPDTAYFNKLMGGLKIQRSILNKPDVQPPLKGDNAAIWGRFDSVKQEEVREFCQKNGISENVFFLTAFNYCINVYSNKSDTLSTSIHNGRTDSRWSMISGCLFATYNFRCVFENQDKVLNVLQGNAKQIMETMCSHANCMHADEMFFQYQGELLDLPEIAGAPAKKLHIQLDSLPFHLMVHCEGDGYLYELRYWKNRFDKEQLELFLASMDAVVAGILKVDTIGELYDCLPEKVFPAGEKFVVNKDGKIQPTGAWGYVTENGQTTEKLARILIDGSMDFIENSGRNVMVESLMGRVFADLQGLEKAVKSYFGVTDAQAYTFVNENFEIKIACEYNSNQEVDEDALMNYIKKVVKRSSLPSLLIKNSTL